MTINITDVSLVLNNNLLFDHMTWSFPDTGLFLLSGFNGSGKTTLINMLTRSITPTSGKIVFLNDSQDFFLVPHDVFMYEYLTGKEFLDLVMKTRSTATQLSYAQNLCANWGLQDSISSQIHNYSLGMKKKLILIASLISGAHTIYLDETLNGVDARSISKIMAELERKGNHCLIILVSHQEEVLAHSCLTKLQLSNKIIHSVSSKDINAQSNP